MQGYNLRVLIDHFKAEGLATCLGPPLKDRFFAKSSFTMGDKLRFSVFIS